MESVLLSETALRRLRHRLQPWAKRLDVLTMGPDGAVRLDGREIAPNDPGPDCALLSNDLFHTGLVATFADVLVKSDSLRWVQSAGAGVDHPAFSALAGKGVRLTTSHGQATIMADYVLWGVLDHYQRGSLIATEQAAHRWTPRRARELGGTRWLIVGFGAIGEAVARRAKGFDAHVTGVRRRPAPSPFADQVTTPDRLRNHLGDSDVVVLCAPRTRETEGLVDADFFAAMKPGSLLVNVARGSLVDEEALLAALDTGIPAHALLDVFRVEPLPATSRFWDHPRVTVTAHTSALGSAGEARADDLFLDNLGRHLAGEPLLHEVRRDEVLAASGVT